MAATLKMAMLRHSATLNVPSGVTDWQGNSSGSTYALTRVHVQRLSGLNVNSLNQEVQTQARLWYDARLSMPHGINLLSLKAQAESNSANLTIVYDGHSYTVSRVIECLDGRGKLHHYEVEMV